MIPASLRTCSCAVVVYMFFVHSAAEPASSAVSLESGPSSESCEVRQDCPECPEAVCAPPPLECPKAVCPEVKIQVAPCPPCPSCDRPKDAQRRDGFIEKPMLLGDQKMQPHMSQRDLVMFRKRLERASSLFEYGAGGSTVWAVRMPHLKRIHTVESDLQWVAALAQRSDIKAAREEGRHLFSVIDMGPTAAWSMPSRNDSGILHRFRSFSQQILEDSGAQWDVVFIDARFRIPCALKAMQYIENPQKTEIMIHDYVTRPAYHIIEEFADVVERGDDLVVLRKKSNVDAEALAAMLSKAELDIA